MFGTFALSMAGRLPMALLAATKPSEGMVSVGFVVFLLAVAGVSLLIEYLYARFGESMAINGRFAITSMVLLLMHVFWRTWPRQTNIAAQSLAPDASGFRLTIWLFLAISILLPLWLVAGAARITWLERYLPGGLGLVLVRVLLCLALVGAIFWLGSDCANVLDGVRLRP